MIERFSIADIQCFKSCHLYRISELAQMLSSQILPGAPNKAKTRYLMLTYKTTYLSSGTDLKVR